MPKGYIPSNTSVHFINYHFVWCPKYRRKVLNDKIRKRLEELIRQKIKEINCEILSLSISEDHVHLFVQANPKLSANYVVGQVKGYTSNVLRKEFQELRLYLRLQLYHHLMQSILHIFPLVPGP